MSSIVEKDKDNKNQLKSTFDFSDPDSISDELLLQYFKYFLEIGQFRQIDNGLSLLKLIKSSPNHIIVKSIMRKCVALFNSDAYQAKVCVLQFMKQAIQLNSWNVVQSISKSIIPFFPQILRYRSSTHGIQKGSTYFLQIIDKQIEDQQFMKLIKLSTTFFRMCYQTIYIWGTYYFPKSNFQKIKNKIQNICQWPNFPVDFKFYTQKRIDNFNNNNKFVIKKMKQINDNKQQLKNSYKSIESPSSPLRKTRQRETNKFQESIQKQRQKQKDKYKRNIEKFNQIIKNKQNLQNKKRNNKKKNKFISSQQQQTNEQKKKKSIEKNENKLYLLKNKQQYMQNNQISNNVKLKSRINKQSKNQNQLINQQQKQSKNLQKNKQIENEKQKYNSNSTIYKPPLEKKIKPQKIKSNKNINQLLKEQKNKQKKIKFNQSIIQSSKKIQDISQNMIEDINIADNINQKKQTLLNKNQIKIQYKKQIKQNLYKQIQNQTKKQIQIKKKKTQFRLNRFKSVQIKVQPSLIQQSIVTINQQKIESEIKQNIYKQFTQQLSKMVKMKNETDNIIITNLYQKIQQQQRKKIVQNNNKNKLSIKNEIGMQTIQNLPFIQTKQYIKSQLNNIGNHQQFLTVKTKQFNKLSSQQKINAKNSKRQLAPNTLLNYLYMKKNNISFL